MSTTVYSQVLIYTAESTGASMERTKMPTLRNGSKGDSNPGSLDCESGILPLSYRAPYLSHSTLFSSSFGCLHYGSPQRIFCLHVVLSYIINHRIVLCYRTHRPLWGVERHVCRPRIRSRATHVTFDSSEPKQCTGWFNPVTPRPIPGIIG